MSRIPESLLKFVMIEETPLYKQKQWIYKKYWTEKKTIKEIAKECNISYPTMHHWFCKLNIPRRNTSEANKIALNKPEIKSKLSKRRKGKKLSLKHRKNMSKTWKNKATPIFDWDFYFENGCMKSNYPYNDCFNFNFKKNIRELYNNKCVITDMSNEKHKKKYGCNLSIHHWTYDKDETNPFYFVPVTKSINIQANHNKSQWIDLFWHIAEDKYCELLKSS